VTRDRPSRPIGLTVAALGVVYGDIGTSPLYALRESLGEAYDIGVTRQNVLGVLSLIFWSLVIVIAVKYVVFILRADNQGEGGILALTALISRPEGHMGKGWRRRLILLGLFGTALLYGDGAITPAISVLAAVEGLEVVNPALEPYVVPIAVGIIVGIFSIQAKGTSAVGSVFGPVMLVWFGVMAVTGSAHLLDDPAVFTAVNPLLAVQYFADNGAEAFLSLGSVFLVVTGGEALYADMGHFGRRPIRLGWYAVVMPALLLNYFGQGALILSEPDAAANPFFGLAPAWAALPMVLLATAASVIASQALISGAFSLTMQAIQLDYSPRMRIARTSQAEAGQVYLGAVNWALMIACSALVVGFGSSSALAAAYGVAVTTTMVVTTLLFGVVMRERFGWPGWVAWALSGGFLVIDLAFFGANLFKIPDGGWLPLATGLIIFTVLTTWRHGRHLLYRRTRRGDVPVEEFVASIANRPVPRVPGTGVYMFPDPGHIPPSLLANLRHNHVLHEAVVLLSVTTAPLPRVSPARRALVRKLGIGFWQVTLTYGFAEVPNVPRDLARLIAGPSFDPSHTTYLLGRETVRSTARPSDMLRSRERLFAVLHRNAGNAAEHFQLPSERVIEIGIPVDI
jgi:KUP system potassium uptake protein